jgi:hypothetical protein
LNSSSTKYLFIPNPSALITNPSLSPAMAPWVTEKYSAVLSTFQDQYRDSKTSKKKEVLREVVQQITAIAEKDGVAIPSNLEKV